MWDDGDTQWRPAGCLAQQVRAERGVQRRGGRGEPAAALGLSPQQSPHEAQGELTPQSACRDVQGSQQESLENPRALY